MRFRDLRFLGIETLSGCSIGQVRVLCPFVPHSLQILPRLLLLVRSSRFSAA
jgi:hypothetical protein